MTPDARRRLGSLSALAGGLFLALSLLPVPLTGRLGGFLGQQLWGMLGLGAVALPVLGVVLALAGFNRAGPLDMKRGAILLAGLALLVPFLVGTLGRVTPAELSDGASALGRLTGWLPGFFAVYLPRYVGVVGAVLLGLLGLSALTLVTLAWHPLQRLEQARE
ncbi:MAG: hypothetical protein MUC69_11890, partial [Gemmatimonadales bacterium]|nr:hypothetical protein [Gemmatimonadales bacterium]